MTIRFYILTLLAIVMSFHLSAQKKILYFNILHNDKVIGTLKAIKDTNDERTIYTDQTIITTHIFTKIEVEYKYEAIYFNNDLIESNVNIFLNGHQKTKTTTEKNNDIYTFYKNDAKENEIDETIQYSTIMLLFNEPKNIAKVYAEEHGVFHNLKKIGDQEYLKTSPEGKKNNYKYKNNSLLRAEIHAGIVNFTMVRTQK